MIKMVGFPLPEVGDTVELKDVSGLSDGKYLVTNVDVDRQKGEIMLFKADRPDTSGITITVSIETSEDDG